MELNLAGVKLMGVLSAKGILLVENVKGPVIINDKPREYQPHNTRIVGSNALGHLVKSRAKRTLMEDSYLPGLATRHSRVIDRSCGGEMKVRRSTLQSSTRTDNADMISVGVERASHCGGAIRPGDISMTDNAIIFDRDGSKDEPARLAGKNILFNWRSALSSVDVRGNVIVNPMGKLRWQSPAQKVSLPDLSSGNKIFPSRGKAGLNPMENTLP